MWALGVWDAGGRRADSSKAMGGGKLPAAASPRSPLETWTRKSSVASQGLEDPDHFPRNWEWLREATG